MFVTDRTRLGCLAPMTPFVTKLLLILYSSAQTMLQTLLGALLCACARVPQSSCCASRLRMLLQLRCACSCPVAPPYTLRDGVKLSARVVFRCVT
jgi:hypothetical protein